MREIATFFELKKTLGFFAALATIAFSINLTVHAENSGFLDKNSLVVTDLKTGIGLEEIPVVITGNQECYNDQKFVYIPEKRRTLLNPLGQAEKSYVGCGVRTLYGTADSTGRVTRTGTNVAGHLYYFENNSYTRVGYLPIPSSDSFLEYFKKTTPGSYLKLHHNVSSKIETAVNKKSGEVTHYFDGSDGLFIAGRNGQKISFDGGRSYSANGHWAVFESSLGNMRLNTSTGEYLIFDKASYNASHNPPFRNFAVSNDGRYVFSIYRYSYSDKTVKLFDLDTCKGDERTDDVHDCQYVDVKKDVLDIKSPRVVDLGVSKPVFTDDLTLKFFRGYKDGDIFKRDLQVLSVGEPVLYKYLALGDSFAAGEGAYSYQPGTDLVTPLNKCHLSVESYPRLIGQKLGFTAFNSVACSGAKLKDIYSLNEGDYNEDDSQAKGRSLPDFDNEILNNFLPGYRTQHNFVTKYLPRNITISVGGNDIGFSDIIKKCAALPEDCYSKPRERADLAKLINDQYYRLVETYGLLKSSSPGATVNVIGYPQITSEDGACAANVRLSQEELRLASHLLIYLNSVIEKASKRAGVNFVNISDALHGHRLCEEASNVLAVNGLTHGDDIFVDIGPIANESYHPNLLGQKLMEKKILERTNSLSKSNPEPDLSIADPKIEDAAAFTDLYIIDFSQPYFDMLEMSKPLWFSGSTSSIESSGFEPNSEVNAYITSQPYQLGKFPVDGNGGVNFDFSLTDEVPFGYHTLHLTGKNVAGEEIEQLQQIYLAHSPEDFDGDGVLNQNEVCLAGEPVGIDEDKDGKDDACDGFIDEPPKEEIVQLPDSGQLPDI